MRRTRATVLATIVALGWALPRPGWALSCDEIMLMLDDGLSTEVVASTLRSSAKKLSPGVVSCLAERSAPSAILEIARELAGTAAASGAAVGGGADDGWLGDQAAPPELTAPPPVAAPPAPPPAVKKPPAPAASPAGIATLGIASDGSPLVSARMYRLGWMQRLRSGLGVEGRVAFMPDR
ncbi:MAG: hypothetical protein VX265_13905, partial [Myxococcota bacterium]|nr:hypothetical protein [Myxococcota bacterium]